MTPEEQLDAALNCQCPNCGRPFGACMEASAQVREAAARKAALLEAANHFNSEAERVYNLGHSAELAYELAAHWLRAQAEEAKP